MKPANPRILAINGGSSSIKFALFEAGDSLRQILEGGIERIGLPEASLRVKGLNQADNFSRLVSVPDHTAAVAALMDWVEERSGRDALTAAGHRVVHGGPKYSKPQRITTEMVQALRRLSPFDPEHLPEEILLIEAFHRRFPDLPQVACFDTAFHHDLPRVARLLPIPRRYEAQGVRRYGFHGLSYAFLMGELARLAGTEAAQGRVILAHLGNGASMAAVRAGKSIDTSMGFTPAAGLVMSTRSGDLDPGLFSFMARSEQMTAPRFDQMVNHESGLLGVVAVGSLYKTAALAKGGSVVAESLGGRLVNPNTTNPDERKLRNVIEEMAIASGVPVPKVYVLDDEKGINAFAAGHSPSDAAIGVTRGCMTLLNRDELQGVIGHEFSHILNGHMRLDLRIVGVIFGIVCLAVIGRVLIYSRGRGSRDRNPLMFLGLALIVIGAIGVFFGRLIQAALSRQREFLADASSVQFTRNPAGLSGALQKIGGAGSRVESAHAGEASHMFFGNGLSKPFLGVLDTHPPLEERIRAIDPGWDGQFKEGVAPAVEAESPRGAVKPPSSRFPFPPIPGMPGARAGAAGFAANVVQVGTVLPSLGKPTPLHLRYAEDLRNSFSGKVQSAARKPLDATALIYAMLLSPGEALRAKQLTELAKRATSGVCDTTAALWPEVAPAASRARLPLANLALPALRQLRPDESRQFSQALQWLIESDEQIEIFEFVLQKIVRRHLAPQLGKTRSTSIQYHTLKPLVLDCDVVLSALANASSSNAGEVEKAFRTGAPHLGAKADGLQLLPPEECGLEQLDTALDRLALAVPQIKKNLIEACVHVVGADGLIQEREAELLRAIADTLDCPIPPFVEIAESKTTGESP